MHMNHFARSRLRAASGPAATGDARSNRSEIYLRALLAARRVVLDMRAQDEIGDDAFHRLEEEFDWMEMRS